MSIFSNLRFPNAWRSQSSQGCDFGRDGSPQAVACSDESNGVDIEARYCRCLTEPDGDVDDSTLAAAWQALARNMALVPEGIVAPPADAALGDDEELPTVVDIQAPQQVDSMYVDRHAVTNADYERFVVAGGYSQMDLWPTQIWPSVVQLIDSTGAPGPRYWADGSPRRGLERHPVVGVCWYEAIAYTRWVGKHLPTPSQWERAGTWHVDPDCGPSQKYPWGNAFDPARANTWDSGDGETVAVDQYYDGCTPNGVYQLIGNVWEWVAGAFQPNVGGGWQLRSDLALAEVRGAAFDTYFPSQATCQFRTGHALTYRGPNVGFRCCVGTAELRDPPDPSLLL